MRTSHPVLFAAAVGGAMGVVVALALAFLFLHGVVRLPVVLALWPASVIFGYDLGSGSSTVESIKIIAMVGGNVIMYATIAAAAAWAFIFVRDHVD